MLVILDTTETYRSLKLDTPDYRLLRTFLSGGPATLVVPTIVIEETVNHYRERLAAALKSMNDALRSLGQLVPDLDAITLPTINQEEATVQYQQRLEKRLKELGAQQPDYQEVRLAALVERALKRRRPFDKQGREGFRDAILWETVLGLLKDKPEEVVIVTANTSDFGAHGDLAEHLRKDLADLGIDEKSVRVCDGLSKFIEEHVKPHLDRLQDIRDQIEEGGYKEFDPVSFFRKIRLDIRWELRRHVRNCDLDRVARNCLGHFEQPELLDLSDTLDNFEIVDVLNARGGEILIGIDYMVKGLIECYEESYMGPDEPPWKERCEKDVHFTLNMTVMLEHDTGEVITWELHDVEIKPGTMWPYREYD